MGVTGLWTVVQPVARPVKLETLAQKRLAIDASIWIYQFLKAVRDKDGNALRNAHVVGFFRRIVKLLFHGIRPVFVFDGGAPLLKRQTIANRKTRRQDRKLDASNTAKKLLSLQMQKRAKEEAEERRIAVQRQYHNFQEEAPVPENPIYASQVFDAPNAPKERAKVKAPFRRLDQYHLPEMDGSFEAMRGANDPRIMSMEELEDYARRFEGGEDINLYDFSKIDFDSPFFTSLPPGDQYNILNAARIRSRLRMGLSKEQLEKMFPNRLEFSRFQIERVRERNELTQRLMHLNGMNDDLISVRRVAGEKDREYVLVKNEGAEGGWALGVVGQKGPREGETVHKAIIVDEEDKEDDDDDDWDEEMAEFEDIPIEGLNRLSKPRVPQIELTRHRQTSEEREIEMAIRLSRQDQQKKALKDSGAPVFIQDDELSEFNEADDEYDVLFEDVDGPKDTHDEDEELRKAIALSLERDKREGEEEERALELALKMSLEQDDEKELGEIIQLSNNSKLSIARHPLNPNKPEFAEFDDTIPTSKSKILPDVASGKVSSSLDKHADNSVSRSTPLGNSSKFESTKTDLNPFALEGAGFTLESMMEYPAGPSNTNVTSIKTNDFSLGSNLLPFESMKLGGLAGLQKRFNDARAVEVKEIAEPENSKAPLPPWFAAEENSALKAGKVSYQVDSYDREDETERIAASIPEHLRPIEHRASIQPKSKEVIVLSEDEDEDVQMIDLASSKPGHQSESVVPGNDTKDLGQTLTEAAEAVFSEAEAQDSGEPVEWEASDVETGDTLVQAPRDGLATNGPGLEDDPGMDSEEEQLMHQMRAENEEHARFASTFNQKSTKQNAMDYERELRTLRDQQKKDRRDADEVTKIMITECQQLLQMFGIPYITAPMEAEAQCAELVNLGLVDGIVTDDSDIFLFGGTRVYKNMFNQAKYVECYLASDLENEYSLDRKKMIRLAHLLGSDYTEGLAGVGPVTALEVLADFGGGDDALNEFKTWWTKVQSGFRDPADDKSKLKKSLKKLSDKLFLPPSFPDDQVDMAYLNPEVDKDSTPFEWGVPDLHGLRNFLMATIGWTSDRTDEVLVPVIRDMNRKVTEGNQVNLTNFFTGSTGAGAFAPRVREANKSKRMENALMSLHRQSIKRQGSNLSAGAEDGEHRKIDESSSTDDELQGVVSLNGRVRITEGNKRKAPAKKKRKTVVEGHESGTSESEHDIEAVESPKQKGKQAKTASLPRNSSNRGKGRGRGRAKKA
ncbi:DNA repair protein rad2 [Orbilia javanica]|uniref:DNA repair protein rad2 n=1 Tax=Orbilia javanica TaxID=47235 RepID=A0AAN8MKR7_9PEZI